MMRRVLVASALVHLAIFAGLARSRPAVAPAPAPPAAMDELAIEMETAAEPVAAPEPESAEAPAPVAAIATARSIPGAPAIASSAAPASSAGTEPIAGGNTDWVVSLGPAVDGRGVPGHYPGASNGTNPFLTRPVETPAPPASARRKDYSLNGALRAQDAAKGLGPDGPVLRALEEETRTSLAPVRGNATFRAIVDATGTVTGLRVLESTGDTQGWDDARQRALAALQKKKLDVRGTNGALIDIRVESELRYPSGATSRVEVTGPLSLGGDLSDLGAKPQRVVHARLSNYTPL